MGLLFTRGIVRPARALSVIAASWLALASGAEAATPAEILQLRIQPCPAYRVLLERDHSPAAVQAAKSGWFDVAYSGPALLVPPVDWAMDPYGNTTWTHNLHGFRWLDQLLHAYVHDDDLDALGQARDLALDWVTANPLSPGDLGPAWASKVAGDRAGYLGFVTRASACRNLLSDAQASVLIDALRAHGTALADPARYHANNHGMFDDLGLALVSDYMSFLPEAEGWLAFARERFRETLSSRLGREGVWLEHSSGYQLSIIRLVERFTGFFGTAGLNADLARMREAAGWFVLPDERMAPVGDSGSVPAEPWAVEEGADDAGLQLMKESGFAVVKDGGSYLIVTAGFHNHTHKHADDLGFHLYDRGQDVITDSGNYTYDVNEWRSFATSVRAHSVLSVGLGTFPIYVEDEIYGSGIQAGGRGAGWYAIEGRNPMLRRHGVGHRRMFLYRPGKALLVVDLVRAGGRHVYTRRFQIAPHLTARRRSGGLALRARGFNGGLSISGDRARLALAKGEEEPPAGWSFPRGGVRVPRTTASYVTRAADADLAAALGLDGEVRARLLRAKGRSLSLRVRGAGLRTRLSVKRRGGRLVVRRR